MKTNKKRTRNPSCFPSVAQLRSELFAQWSYLRRNFDRSEFEERGNEEFSGTDCRLQVRKGHGWQLHVGSSDYDQDHRGAWGASCIPFDRSNLTELAKDLIDQTADNYAETEALENG